MKGASAAGPGTSPLTTKGDVYGFDTADARIPVGADGEVLTADSGEALGVKWATGGGASSVVSYAVWSVDNFAIGAAATQVDFASIDQTFDSSGRFGLSAGGDLEVNEAGIYLLHIAFNNFTFAASQDAQLFITADVISGSVGTWSNRPGSTELTGDLIYNIVSDNANSVQGAGDRVYSAIIGYGSGASFPSVIRVTATWLINEAETAATPDVRAAMVRIGDGD